jgi:hypothetical protein
VDFLSVQTIGGLATSIHGRDSSRFIGYLDCDANSAKRDAASSVRAPPEVLRAWADEQIELLIACNATPLEWCAVTCGLCDLELDPFAVAHVPIFLDGRFSVLTIAEVFDLVRVRSLAMFKSAYLEHVETYHNQIIYQSYPTLRPVRNCNFLSLELISGSPKHERSFIGCLYRYAASQGCQLKFEERRNVGQSPFGLPLHVVLLTVA